MRLISDLVLTADLVTFAGSSNSNYVLRLVQETVLLGYRWDGFMNIGSIHVLTISVLLSLLTPGSIQGFKGSIKVSRFYSGFQGSIQGFRVFVELFAPGG